MSLGPLLPPELTLTPDTTPELKRAKLRVACRMFESQMLKTMFKAMREATPRTGLIYGGWAEEIFTGLWEQAVADEAVKNRSIGIARLLEQQLGKALYRTQPQRLRLPVRGAVTSPFGPRRHPITGRLHAHKGIDIAAPEGAPVEAAAGGIVSFAGEQEGYGRSVVITHPDGTTTLYAHCKDLLVKEGQRVVAGQVIATVGSTGMATGAHLHFELRAKDGKAVDPAPILGLKTGNETGA